MKRILASGFPDFIFVGDGQCREYVATVPPPLMKYLFSIMVCFVRQNYFFMVLQKMLFLQNQLFTFKSNIMGKINDLKNEALASLNGKWLSFVGLTFIYLLLYGLAQFLSQFGSIFQGSSFTTLTVIFMTLGMMLSILLVPLQYGYNIAYLNSSRQDLPADTGDLFFGYNRFGRVFGTLLLMVLAISAVCLPYAILVVLATRLDFLNFPVIIGCFILLVPAIMLGIAYAMVPYIIHDDEELAAGEILKKSRMMMKGHKWDYFVLMLSFFGWMLLGVLTLFIGYLWLIPYMQMTEFKFYERVRAEYEGVPEEEMPMPEEMPRQEETPQEAETPAEAAE